MASARGFGTTQVVKQLTTILSVIAMCLLASCSGSQTTEPPVQYSSIRFYNGLSQPASLRQGDATEGTDVAACTVSSVIELVPKTDSATFRAYNTSTNQRLASASTILSPGFQTAVLFPTTSAIGGVNRAETLLFKEDAAAPPPGRARVRVINATPDGTGLSLLVDGMEVVKQDQLGVRAVSNVVDIVSGSHDVALLRKETEQYDAALRTLELRDGASYTLLLSGTLSYADQWPFRARMYRDDKAGQDYTDLYIPPDVGKYQVVHAVTGLKNFEVKIDGTARQQTSAIAFSENSGYVDLEIGTHTTGVFVNSSPLIQETRTTTTLRSRKTLFVTGSMVPPNLAGLELMDLTRPLSASSASIRLINLSPDAPSLDFYVINNGTEVPIEGSMMLDFREATSTAGGNLQFIELPAGRVTILAKKANTQTIVLPQTQISLLPGEISTLWVGGLSSTIKLYTVKHN